MPNPETTWRYTASSGEVVRTDGVLIARDVPEAFGKLVEAAPTLLTELHQCAVELEEAAKLMPSFPGCAYLYAVAASRVKAAIARARL